MTEADHQHHKLIILNLADDPVAADAGILIDQSKFGAHVIKRTCRGFATLQLFQFKPCEVEIFEIVHSMRDQFLKEKGFVASGGLCKLVKACLDSGIQFDGGGHDHDLGVKCVLAGLKLQSRRCR